MKSVRNLLLASAMAIGALSIVASPVLAADPPKKEQKCDKDGKPCKDKDGADCKAEHCKKEKK